MSEEKGNCLIFNKLQDGWSIIDSPFYLAERGIIAYKDGTTESWSDFCRRNFESEWLHLGIIQSKAGNAYFIHPQEVDMRDFSQIMSAISAYALLTKNTSNLVEDHDKAVHLTEELVE